jgi:orotate phosphoribosyltransferase
MTESEALVTLQAAGAIRKGHFVLTSRRHSAEYVNKDAVYCDPLEILRFCRALAERCQESIVEVVVGPTLGGAMLAQWVAYALSNLTGKQVLAAYAEKTEKPSSALWYFCFALRLLWKKIPQFGRAPSHMFVIKRDYEQHISGKSVLIVDDIITTGDSARKTVKAVRDAGGDVAGVAVLCNRGVITPADVGNPPQLIALVNLNLKTWTEGDCPLCKLGVPINTKLGKGREYVGSQH